MRYFTYMKKIFVFTILFFLCWQVLPAQTFPFRTYSIQDGLSESVVNAIAQDQNGFIWLGTGVGLNKFDGIHFTYFFEDQGLNSSKILALHVDSKNRVWAGSSSGINVIMDDSVHSFPVYESLKETPVISIFEDADGGMWFGTDGNGVWHFYGNDELVVYTTSNGLGDNHVRAITQTENGDLWFATRNGLSRLSEGNFRTFDREDGLGENRLRDILIDPDSPNSLWIATRNGLTYFAEGVFTNFNKELGLRDEKIHTLSIDNHGHVWCGTEGGVSEFTGERFLNYTTEQGLSTEIIYSSITDREGNIWFGSMGGGVNLFLGKYFENYNTENGLPNELVTAVVKNKEGEIWMSTYGGGLIKFEDGEFEYFYSQSGLPDNRVYRINMDSQNRMWIGMRDGVAYLKDGKLVTISDDELPYRKIRHVLEARDGSLWFSTYDDGLIHQHDGILTQYNTDDGFSSNTVVQSVEAEDGSIWAATYGGVVVIREDEVEVFSAQQGLPHNGVMSIMKDESGTIWVSTFGGIAWFDGVRFVDITEEDGLPGRVCYFITQTNDGYLWVGTNRGVARLDIQKFYSDLEGEQGRLEREQSLQILNTEQGLVSNETNLGAVFEEDNGTLWFGTVEGVSKFDKNEFRGNQVAPIININEFSVLGKRMEGNHFELDHDQNYIQIDYSAINFTAPNQVVYEHKITGIDPDWQITTDHLARYTSLPPGDYTFRVRARNSAGIWSEETASISFSVASPFWRTWWFLSFIVLIIVGIIYLFYRNYQYMQMVDIERMRVRIASDLHDDVGASLTEIALQSDFLQASVQDDLFKDSLIQIGKQCRTVVTSLDDIVWSIDARNDTLGDFTDRMQDYILNVLAAKGFQVFYDFEDLKMDEKIPVTLKENMYLIFKEAVNNIAKYSNGDKVRVTMKSNGMKYRFEIFDNGTTGMGNKKTGHGLRNMEMRAQRIGGNVTIDSKDGFKIILTGKLNSN